MIACHQFEHLLPPRVYFLKRGRSFTYIHLLGKQRYIKSKTTCTTELQDGKRSRRFLSKISDFGSRSAALCWATVTNFSKFTSFLSTRKFHWPRQHERIYVKHIDRQWPFKVWRRSRRFPFDMEPFVRACMHVCRHGQQIKWDLENKSGRPTLHFLFAFAFT